MSPINDAAYRGSKWRKWDLQLHCPDDVLYNQFSGKTAEEKWENYITTLEHMDVEAIAITNYFCINGYKKVLNYKKSGRLNNIGLILPNIEFRLSQPNQKGESINIHVIFNDESNILERISGFLDRLKIVNTDEYNKALYCSPSDLQKVGYDKALVDFNDLIKELGNGFFHLKDYMIVGVAHGYGSFRPAQNDSRGAALATEIDKHSDFFFGNADNKEFYLDISRFNGAKQKPVVKTSDAHDLDKIGSDYTLIKADCTFNGMKQITYEPMDRISLDEAPPLYLHPQIISVKLLNNNQYESKKNYFPPITLNNEIYFSSNFNSVIGPRASGKTVLMELIGFVSNTFSKEKKDETYPLIDYLSKSFNDLEVELSIQIGTELEEKHIRSVKNWKDPLYSSPIKVEYWIQGDIEKKANSTKEIADYISERLQSDYLINIEEEIEALNKEMLKLRNNYSSKLQIEIEKNKYEAECKQIELYFKKLETDEYKMITKKLENNRIKHQIIDGLIQDLKNQIYLIKNLAKQMRFNRTVDKKDAVSLFEKDKTLREKIESYYGIENTELDSIITDLKVVLDGISGSDIKKELEKENNELKNEFTTYCEKNGIKVTNEEIEKRNSRIEYLSQQISKLNNKLESLEDDKNYHEELSRQLQRKVQNWIQENNKLIEEFNKSISGSEINAQWDNPNNFMKDWIIDQITRANSELKEMIENNYKKKSPLKEHNLEEIIHELFEMHGDKTTTELLSYLEDSSASKLKERSGKIETIKWLFEDVETKTIREDIIMRIKEYSEVGTTLIRYGEKILGKDSMSFGERCGTLVELIVLSGDHPLIIDQPEDHLDAKFVADKVVKLIREQKVNRQIIICTHNANLVILGDSEIVTTMSVNSKDEVDIKQGSLESIEIRELIIDILEGGETAFKKREQKYSEIIT